jgi:peroxiredoxin
MAEASATGISIGDTVPEFELPDTEGTRHALSDGAQATAVIFTCNHCPYALAWHDRIVDVARDYTNRGVRILAINSNDSARYPADSYEAMQERVRKEDWPLPYLHDESQAVARAYGAKTTPDVFVIDSEGRLRYRGAPDADHSDPSLNAAWLRAALDAVLEGRDPDPAETEPVGCSVKWK